MACASNISMNGQCKRLYESTEHNLDLYSIFFRFHLGERYQQRGQFAHTADVVLRSLDSVQIDNAAPPLTVNLIKNGGASLTVVDNVVTRVGEGNVLPTYGCELDEEKTRLRVKVLKSGGAHLTRNTSANSTPVTAGCNVR